MIRRRFLVSSRRLRLASLTLAGRLDAAARRLGMVITQSDIASQIGFQVIKNGGNAIDAAVATAFALAVTHPDRRQHRRRRLHRLPSRHRRADVVRLPRSRAVALVTGDVAEGRQVRLRHASQQPPVGRRARHGGRPAPGVEGTGIEAVEGAGAAGDRARARRLRGLARTRPLARRPARRLQEVSRVAGAVLEERQAVRSRRHPQAARSGENADAHRRSGSRRILRRRDRGADRKGNEGQRRPDHAWPTSRPTRPRSAAS